MGEARRRRAAGLYPTARETDKERHARQRTEYDWLYAPFTKLRGGIVHSGYRWVHHRARRFISFGPGVPKGYLREKATGTIVRRDTADRRIALLASKRRKAA